MFMISASAGDHGTISPSGQIQVKAGAQQTFEFIPEKEYRVFRILIDGQIRQAEESYTFTNVDQDYILNVLFIKEINHTIKSLTTNGGKILPYGEIIVPEFGSQTFQVFPDKGYMLSTLIVDDKKVGPYYWFNFQNVIENHEITAEFIGNKNQCTISGHVYSHTNAVQGMSIQIFADDRFDQLISQTLTDLDGNYIITGLQPMDNIVVRCSPPLNTPVLEKFNYVPVILPKEGYYSTRTDKSLEVNFLLEPANTISGNVYYENSENEAPCRVVLSRIERIRNKNYQLISDITTQTNGDFTFWGLAPQNDYIVAAWPVSGKYLYQTWENKNGIQLETADPIDITKESVHSIYFKLNPLCKIQGTVHNGTTGIPDIKVKLSPPAFQPDGSIIESVVTDEFGRFTIKGLLNRVKYIVYIQSDNSSGALYYSIPKGETVGSYVPTYSALLSNEATPINCTQDILSHIDIVVQQRGMIRGQVISPDTTYPVKGIWVNAWSDTFQTGNGAITDEKGFYEINGLFEIPNVPGVPNGYIVEIQPQGFAYQAFDQVTDRSQATLVPTGSEHIDFNLQYNLSISGRIMDAAGKPISNVIVYAVSRSNPLWEGKTESQDDGTYVISNLLPEKDYLVHAYRSDLPVIFYNGQTNRENAAWIDLSEGQVTGIDFIMDQGHTISGKVLLEDTVTGVPGIWVNLWSQTKNTGFEVKTDETGFFRFIGLDANVSDYYLYIKPDDYAPAFYCDNGDQNPMNDTVYVSSDAKGVSPSLLSRNLILIQSGFTIRGKILYENMPVSGVRIDVFSSDSGGRGTCVSKNELIDNVNCEISLLPPGTYQVYISSDAFVDQYEEKLVVDSQMADFIVYMEKNPLRSISGTIIGLEPDKKILIIAWSATLNQTQQVTLIGTGQPQTYQINHLNPASDYVVILWSENYPSQVFMNKFNFSDADLVDLTHNNVSNIDFEMVENTNLTSISGIITFPETTIPGDIARINACASSIDFCKSISIQLDESYDVPYIMPAIPKAKDYIVSAKINNYPSQYYNQTTDLDNASWINTEDDIDDNTIHFSFEQGGSIAGYIYDMNGMGIPDINVAAWSKETDSWWYAISQSNGNYIIKGLKRASDYYVGTRIDHYGLFLYNETGTVRHWDKASAINIKESNQEGINLTIRAEKTIEGFIMDSNGAPLNDIWVDIWSDTIFAGNGVYSNEEGHFIAYGLPQSGDYRISVLPHWSLPYLPDIRLNVSTGSRINFKLATKDQDGFVLTGFVKDDIETPVRGALVQLSSSKKDFIGWHKTDRNGIFLITGIIQSDDYVLQVKPSKTSSLAAYCERDISIAANETKTITLPIGYSFSGQVVSYDNEGNIVPVKRAKITALSEDQRFRGEAYSDKEGYYIVPHAPLGSDYIIVVAHSDYLTQRLYHQTPEEDAMTFYLEQGGTITGKVLDAATGKPVENAIVQVYSRSIQNSSTRLSITQENPTGTITIQEGIKPIIYDLAKSCYLSKNSQSPLSKSTINILPTIDLTHVNVTSINSIVISDEILSSYASGTTRTDRYGQYKITGLKTTLINSNDPLVIITTPRILTIEDYIVIVYADNFPPHYKEGIKPGERVDFQLSQNINNTLSGEITNLSKGCYGLLYIFESDKDYIQKIRLDTQNQFNISTLLSHMNYELLFQEIQSGIVKRSQWANSKGVGVQEREDCGEFSTGDYVSFSFSAISQKKQLASVIKRPGPVKNLRAITHVYMTVRSHNKSNIEYISVDPDVEVSNNPTVIVEWDPSEQDDRGYYYEFNSDENFEFSDENTFSKFFIQTTTAESPALAGDDTLYCFHVAPIDYRGDIGETETISFRIDTLPPYNLFIESPKKTYKKNIKLKLGATGATDVYVSNVGYNEGSYWENFVIEKAWQLSDIGGTNPIYIQFRDMAGNVSKTVSYIDYTMDSLYGDLNLDCKVTIDDAIIGLKLMITDQNQIQKYNDVNQDNRIGLEDVIYILHELAANQ